MVGPSFARQHGADLRGQVDDVVEERVVAPEPRRGAQCGARLAHFGAVEEPLGAAQLVGHPGVGEGLFVQLGLGVRTEEDRDLARGDTGGDEVADAAGGALGLGGLVRVLGVDGFGARGPLGDQLQAVLGGPAAGLGEQAVGEVNDLGRGAVVAYELDDGGPGMAGAEVEKVVGSCTGERIDRLAGVADDTEAVALAEPQVQQTLLQRADVLVLVDHEVLVLRADLLRDVVAVLKDGDRQQQDVLEVDDRAVPLEVFVGSVELGDFGWVAGASRPAFAAAAA